MAGAGERIEREANVAVAQAWHTANLMRATKMPALDKYLKPARKPEKAMVMTPEQIAATMRGFMKGQKRNG